MDINHHSFTNTTWELNLTMEDHILHDQLPFDALFWPHHHYPIQTHHQTSPPSSTQTPAAASSGGLFGAQKENHHKMEVEKEKEEQEQEDREEPEEELGAMKEMMYKIAAMQPVDIDPATIRKPKRRNVRISDDPQSVAARRRRERISEKIRILQRLVPGGTKMDTASMLDEAIRYVKFLKRQIRQLQSNHQVHHPPPPPPCIGVGHGGATGDWAVAPNKAHGSATSSAVEPPGRLSDMASDAAAPVILHALNMS